VRELWRPALPTQELVRSTADVLAASIVEPTGRDVVTSTPTHRFSDRGRQFWKVPRWSLEGSPVVAALLVAHMA
jgi:hypothetical protein